MCGGVKEEDATERTESLDCHHLEEFRNHCSRISNSLICNEKRGLLVQEEIAR